LILDTLHLTLPGPEFLIYAFVALLTVGFPAYYILRDRRKSAAATAMMAKAALRGLDEPASLHPTIDPDSCIGTGACVKACPEERVIGLIEGKAALINPSRCIGHGLCAAACPVSAISLVFGTAKRGVDIPHVSGTFESNIPGIYIAGELGGMGLIRNAVTQGRQAVENIVRSLGGKDDDDNDDDVYDLAIVGAGPAGIGGALAARKAGLKFIIFDQDDFGGTILTYPRRKLVLTAPIELPLHGKVSPGEISKEALLELLLKVCSNAGLAVRSGEKIESITSSSSSLDGIFNLTARSGEHRARRVLLATGRRGSPRKLGVPGEGSGKVAYRLTDPEKFHHLRILVVGGGDSAVESAVSLSEQPGNTVHISYRQEEFYRIKEGNRERIKRALRENRVVPLFLSEVKQIEADTVQLEQQGKPVILPNDQVFVFAGGELPAEFLQRIGIQFTRKFGQK